MYSITEGFSPILYCRPDVVTLGNPFDTMKRFCLYSQCSHLNLKTLFHLRWMLRRFRCVQIFLRKVMRLYKRRHRPITKRFIKSPLLHIESSLDQLGLQSCCRLPTTSVLSNKSDKYVPTSFDQQFQVSQGHTSYKKKGKLKYRGPWWWRP